MPTGASNRKVRELIQGLTKETLIPKPSFQRRLVWSKEDKIRFIETVLLDLPFPEIYIANDTVDTTTGEGTEILVDGQQRTVTLKDYFDGIAPFDEGKLLTRYSDMEEPKQRAFLNYEVAVRHLGDATKEQIIEIFRRINATKYALNEMEVNNAIFAGKLKSLSQEIAESGFFEKYRIFRPLQLRRMGDTRYVLGIAITLMSGYFNRDELFEEYLQRYNDEFPDGDFVRDRFFKALSFIDDMELSDRSRAFKQADLYTLIVEVDRALQDGDSEIDVDAARDKLQLFYASVDNETVQTEDVLEYRKAVLQAANDRTNRRARGRIVGALLRPKPAKVAVEG